LDSLRQCRFKHRLGYVERWRPEEEAETLSRGRMFHRVMEEHYLMVRAQQRGETDRVVCVYCGEEFDGPVEAKCSRFEEKSKKQHEFLPVVDARIQRIKDLLCDPETGETTEMQGLVRWMYDGYLHHYGVDADWQVVKVEHRVEEWMPTDKGTRSSFKMKGTIDLIVRDMSAGGGLWIVDHKTCKNLPKGREHDLDDQFAIYQWLLRQRGNDIRGIIYNSVRTERLKTREMEPSERFKRQMTVRSETELNTVVGEAYEHFVIGYRGVQQAASGEAPTELPPIPPRNPDPDRCRWRCPFTEPCLASRKGKSHQLLLPEMGYRQDFDRH
jgi:hypothetical protein